MRQFLLALLLVTASAQAQVGNPGGLGGRAPASGLALRPTCEAANNGARWEVTDASAIDDCSLNGGSARVECTCRDGEWTPTNTPGPAGPQGPPGDWTDEPSGAMKPLWKPLAQMPAGWQYCDGTNLTPDMRGSFARGGEAGQEGDTGGADTHGHDYSDVVSHTHAVDVTDPQHAHVEQVNSSASGGLSGFAARDTSTNTPSPTGYSTAPAATGITATTSPPAGSAAAGTTATASNLPAYVTVLWICKL